jgi:hypothetical protein
VDAKGSGVAFPGGDATDASPLETASPLGSPSADNARNVRALVRHGPRDPAPPSAARPAALEALDRTLAAALSIKDPRYQAQAISAVAKVIFSSGQPEQVLSDAEQALSGVRHALICVCIPGDPAFAARREMHWIFIVKAERSPAHDAPSALSGKLSTVLAWRGAGMSCLPAGAMDKAKAGTAGAAARLLIDSWFPGRPDLEGLWSPLVFPRARGAA